MVGWRHQLNGLESEQAPGSGDGQGGLVCCCSPWDRRVRHSWATELNSTEGLKGRVISNRCRKSVNSVPQPAFQCPQMVRRSWAKTGQILFVTLISCVTEGKWLDFSDLCSFFYGVQIMSISLLSCSENRRPYVFRQTKINSYCFYSSVLPFIEEGNGNRKIFCLLNTNKISILTLEDNIKWWEDLETEDALRSSA